MIYVVRLIECGVVIGSEKILGYTNNIEKALKIEDSYKDSDDWYVAINRVNCLDFDKVEDLK